ncbi:MAG: ATP-binding protein [Limnochordia bacterium]|jgi:hypothetical protein
MKQPNTELREQSYVPARLAIEAMRDNGYKNTAYAVAELIDNSIQAEAKCVHLLCAEAEERGLSRRVKRIREIAVLDNGTGMSASVLKTALQFGNGTRLDKTNRTGIGRFGMGLPASSVSQCQRVEVWSWQNGVENALYTYLDVVEVKNGQDTVPEPEHKAIPRLWKDTGVAFGSSGTLVVWKRLDRMLWAKARTLIDNSELLIGRIYRKFLSQGKVELHMKAFDIGNPKHFTISRLALPNDPLYLMSKTSCPEPFTNTPMFSLFGEPKIYTIEFDGRRHQVCVTYSYAKDEARAEDNAGSTPYGKHAAKNVGISIVRADRELDIDMSLVNSYDPRERWWGVEISFPPSLDELMGVTNNKQSARHLSSVLSMVDNEIDEMLKSGKTLHQYIGEMEDEEDPRAPLIRLANDIRNNLRVIRQLIEQQRKGTRSPKKRYEDVGPERTATRLTDERKRMGYLGSSDDDEKKPLEERTSAIAEELVVYGIDETTAQHLAANTISNNLKYLFIERPVETDAFFTVRPRGGAINIVLNTRHPAYDNLVEVISNDTTDCGPEELSQRLSKASRGLKLLLMAWARFEDEVIAERKELAEEFRADWGRVAKYFLRENGGDS